jgi:pyruvate,water dikinase
MAKKGEFVNQGFVKWLPELSKEDVPIAGGKGANLAEMYNNKFPVPPAFVITAQAYEYFLEASDLKQEIKRILENVDIEDTEDLEERAKKIRALIVNADFPEDLREEILESYDHLSFDKESLKNATSAVASFLKTAQEYAFVAVRSSATIEDSKKASFAGQQESYLGVRGKSSLIEHVKKCWASLFTGRSVYYRIKKKFPIEKALIAVIVQKMINSDKSGVIFTRNPITQDESVVIEAVFGLGEGIVSGKINPDHYVVSRELKIIENKVANKKIALIRNSAGNIDTIKLTEERSRAQVLTDSEIKRLANYSIELEEHYKIPQDIEFAIESREIYIVQTRPITTLEKKISEEVKGNLLLSGAGASPGVGSGIVKVIFNLNDLKKIQKGDVLVTKMTNPDMVVTMQRAAAIVTDEGGLTSHAAIISREMGIPAVVGTEKATSTLKEGMKVSVDGFNGKIYSGESVSVEKEIEPIIENTRTKIKLILDLPQFAERAKKTNASAIGLVRIEGIIAEGGKHPMAYLKENKLNDYTKMLADGLEKISKHFNEIWIRTSDIRSDEYMHLKGSPKEVELNPMLGMHGIRYSLKYPKILEAEFAAIKKVADKFPEKILGVMFPQVISIEEVRKAKEIFLKFEKENIKFGVMVETPAAVQIIKSLCEEGIKFISFGTNDLTQYTLAIDRGNEEVQYLYDETNPAVLSQLKRVIKICKGFGVETSICGQAGSNKEMVAKLIEFGIDSISVNADAAYEISELINNIEGNRGKDNANINKIDNLEHVEEKIKEVREEMKEKKFKKKIEEKESEPEVEYMPANAKESSEHEEGEEIKGKGKEESEEKEKKEAEEWPETDFSVDVFANQSPENKEEKYNEEEQLEEEKEQEKENAKESSHEHEIDKEDEETDKEQESKESEEKEDDETGIEGDEHEENEELDIF